MVEIAIAVAGKIAEYLVDPIARLFRDLWNYKTNFEKLENEVKKLQARIDTVQCSVCAGVDPLPDVKFWQENVKKIIDETLELINEDNPEQANTQCCKGFSSPNLLKRYQRSKKAAGKLKDVVGLWREGGEFREYSRPTITKQPWLQSSENYEAFESRTSILKKIMHDNQQRLQPYKVPELRSFYPDRHTVEGRVLKTLQLCDCGIHHIDEEGHLHQPLSLVEKTRTKKKKKRGRNEETGLCGAEEEETSGFRKLRKRKYARESLSWSFHLMVFVDLDAFALL
ncbi:hypothetical protein Ddye_028195 [Dipteronia dyeriana]|uniref:Uncharacterized protein n=1 Tax=Dipteronia dyeriana TaxID=168575 RepID=A0AAD9TQI3_9ROSI|nr:hypothetical protein Ddye_028195 [Dipteronia dyeriana]